MSRLTGNYITQRGGLATLSDGTQVRAGFNDSASRMQVGEVVNGLANPDKTEIVTFTVAAPVNVEPEDIITYAETRYRVDRIVPRGQGDDILTHIIVASRA